MKLLTSPYPLARVFPWALVTTLSKISNLSENISKISEDRRQCGKIPKMLSLWEERSLLNAPFKLSHLDLQIDLNPQDPTIKLTKVLSNSKGSSIVGLYLPSLTYSLRKKRNRLTSSTVYTPSCVGRKITLKRLYQRVHSTRVWHQSIFQASKSKDATQMRSSTISSMQIRVKSYPTRFYHGIDFPLIAIILKSNQKKEERSSTSYCCIR